MNHPLDDEDDEVDGIFGNLREVDDPKIESIFDPITTPFASDDVKHLQKVILAREQALSEMAKELSQSNDKFLVEHLRKQVDGLTAAIDIEKQTRKQQLDTVHHEMSMLQTHLEEMKAKLEQVEKSQKANKITLDSDNVIVSIGNRRTLPGIFDEEEQ